MFKFYIYKLGQFLVKRLSLKNAYRLAMFISDLHYMMSFRDRRAVKNNLKVIFNSDADMSLRAREVFRNFGKYLVEFFRFANELDDQFVRENVKVINRHYLDEAIAKEKGVVLVTAHLGNWELGGLVLGMMGYPVLAITLSHKERPVNELFNKQRESRGVVAVPIKQAVHKCLNALKNNKMVALLADRDFTSSGEVVKFLGRDVLIPKGAALFAYKTGATILPTFFLREDDNTFSMQFEAPIYPSVLNSGQIEHAEMMVLIQQYANVIEKKIRQYPTQWLMFREFWDAKANMIADIDERIV
ncbi:MAG: lysophospholipid acyltransferase family protein [Candidatus Omnitrophica bacterium]|nr:lysophospholipid acyltransferase family protein [Candidatus Omnitrophota bacterium]